jgi:NADH-quinone oxidoreductase subunit K
MHLLYPLVLSALLFAIGVYGLLARRNAVLVLMAVELMLNAVNLDLVAFDAWLGDTLHSGQVFALFVITIAAAEVGVGLAIVLQVFRLRATVAIDELDDLVEPDAAPRGSDPVPGDPVAGPGAGGAELSGVDGAENAMIAAAERDES